MADSSRHACVCVCILVVTETPEAGLGSAGTILGVRSCITSAEQPHVRDALTNLWNAVYRNDIIDRQLSVAAGNSCKDLQNNVLMENTRIHDGYLIRGITFIKRPLF